MAKFVRTIRDFSGGLSEVANDNMRDNELAEAMNAVPGESYGVARASGTRLMYPQIADLGSVQHLIELQLANGMVQVIAFTDAGNDTMNMYWYDEVDKAWSSISQGIRAVKSWFTYANKLYWLDGMDYKLYDGTAVSSVTEEGTSNLWNKIKTALAVEQRGQRWFFATRDNEIIFSDIGKVNKFTGTNVINITSGKADSITALHEFNNGLLIFQQRSVYYLAGYDFAGGTDINLSRLNVSCGTQWPESVKTIENAVLYMGNNGIYRLYIPAYNESLAAKNISEKKIGKLLSSNEIVSCSAEVWNNIYYFSLQTSTKREEYRYYVSAGSFWGPFTQGATCYAAGFLGEDALYIGCSNGYIVRYDEDSTHYVDLHSGQAAPIPMRIKTKGFDVCGAMVQYAKVKKAFIAVKQFAAQSSGLSVQIKADYADSAWNWKVNFDESLVYSEGIWGEGYWGWKDTVTKEISVNRKTQRIQLIFYDETTDMPVMIYGIGFLYKKKKVKGSRTGVEQADILYED